MLECSDHHIEMPVCNYLMTFANLAIKKCYHQSFSSWPSKVCLLLKCWMAYCGYIGKLRPTTMINFLHDDICGSSLWNPKLSTKKLLSKHASGDDVCWEAYRRGQFEVGQVRGIMVDHHEGWTLQTSYLVYHQVATLVVIVIGNHHTIWNMHIQCI